MRWQGLCSAFLLGMAATSLARAQASPGADELFREGLAELKAGNLSRACPLIADSYALDPQPGALFTLAECEARAGKLASASLHFQAFLERARALAPAERRRQAERVRAAEQRVLELEPRLPRLTIVPPADLPAGAEISNNGEIVPRPAWSSALPVDPGSYLLVLTLPDGRSSRAEVSLAEREAHSVSLELPAPALATQPKVEQQPPPPAPPPAPPPVPAPAREAEPRRSVSPGPPEARPSDRPGGARRALMYAAFGVGTAGVVVGSVAGALLISRKSTVDEHCPDARCDDEGFEATRDIPALDTTANVGFAAGALGLGAGLLLLLTEPAPSRPAVGLSPAGAVVRGRF